MSALEVSTDEDEEAPEEEDGEHEVQLETVDQEEGHQSIEEEERDQSLVEQTASTLISNKEDLSGEQMILSQDHLRFQESLICSQPDYQLDSEYFSDPDFHDERPGKTSLVRRQVEEEGSESESIRAEPLENALMSEEEQIVYPEDDNNQSNNSILCPSQELHNEVENSSNEPVSVIDNDTVLRDLKETQAPDEHLSEQASELDDQITASEARPELLVEETSATFDDTCVHYSNSRDSSQSDCSQSPSDYPSSCCEEAATLNQIENLEDFSRKGSSESSLQIDLASESGDLVPNNIHRESVLELSNLITDNIVAEAFNILGIIKQKVVTSSEEEENGKNSEVRGEMLEEQINKVEENVKSQTRNRKLYTSSMYYDDDTETYPTIEQQVELCRSVADTLTGKCNIDTPSERATSMFKQRRERMRSFTLESTGRDNSNSIDGNDEISEDNNGFFAKRRASLDLNLLQERGSNQSSRCQLIADSLTDTEYEAPQVRHRTQPRRAITTLKAQRARRSVSVLRQCEVPQLLATTGNNHDKETQARFKPFLDSESLKDIARLRQRFPPGTCNEHDTVPPELCHRLANELKSGSEDLPVDISIRGASVGPQGSKRCLLLESSDWILGEQKSLPDLDMAQAVGREENNKEYGLAEVRKPRPSLSEETVMVAEEAAAEQQVVELAPEPVKHTQPQLELATVTRTASFMSSSRLVIECDSPDLLTSRDDEDEDEEEPLDGVEEEQHKQVPALRAESREAPSNMHYATLLEWRHRLMTPTLMIFDVPQDPKAVESSSRCSSVVDLGETEALPHTIHPECQPRPFSVANMRLRYQRRLERLHSKTYSSYRYPFARSPADCLLAFTVGEQQHPHQPRRCLSLEPADRHTSGCGGPQGFVNTVVQRPGAHLCALVNGTAGHDDCIGEPLGRNSRGGVPASRGVLATTHLPESVCGRLELSSSASSASYSRAPPPPQPHQQVPTGSAPGDSCGSMMEAHASPNAFQASASASARASSVLDYRTSRHQNYQSSPTQDRPRPPAESEASPCHHYSHCASATARLLQPATGAAQLEAGTSRNQCGQEVELLPLNRRSSEALRAVLVQRPKVNYCAIINR